VNQSLFNPHGVCLPGPTYQFGDFELDCGRFELRRKGQSLRVERKPMELLILLASREGRLVTRAEIAERLWTSEIFVDTEHGINTAIRKLRYLLRDDPDEPQFIQTVTGMGYRFVAPITTCETGKLNRALAAATASIAHDEPAKPEAKIPASFFRSRRFWIEISASSAILFAILAVTAGRRPLAARLFHRRPPPITSIAVLPLDNLSGNPNQEYFADGMTDELTTMLAKDSTLRIISRTSAMQYKRARRPLPEIARALGVDGILEGSVARSSDQIHMTLQLIRGDDDSHVWAESYDRDANDVTLPDEAARAIAKTLHRAATIAAPARYVNPEAHDAWLRGRYLWFQDRIIESGPYFRKATEIQPDYAPGWAGLSMHYSGGTVPGALDPRTSLPAEEDTAVRALQLDPSLADAHLAMGAAYFYARWDFARADQEILRAIELDPRAAEPYHLRARLLEALNRQDEAIESEKKAMELDPFERPWSLVWAYRFARRYDAALDDARLRLETYPADPVLLLLTADTYRCEGRYKEAVDYWVKLSIAFGDRQRATELLRAFHRGGYSGVVRLQLADATRQAKKRYVPPVVLAWYHAQLGHREETLSLLEEGYRQHAPGLLWLQDEMAYDFLHNDPRYRSLIEKIGLPWGH
jgi:TolB-like protein/DNA-binding winged helix-turn-helix (wHTH) protein